MEANVHGVHLALGDEFHNYTSETLTPHYCHLIDLPRKAKNRHMISWGPDKDLINPKDRTVRLEASTALSCHKQRSFSDHCNADMLPEPQAPCHPTPLLLHRRPCATQLQHVDHGPCVLRKHVSGVNWRDAHVHRGSMRMGFNAFRIAYVGLCDLTQMVC
jgi:hypothetical protein